MWMCLQKRPCAAGSGTDGGEGQPRDADRLLHARTPSISRETCQDRPSMAPQPTGTDLFVGLFGGAPNVEDAEQHVEARGQDQRQVDLDFGREHGSAVVVDHGGPQLRDVCGRLRRPVNDLDEPKARRFRSEGNCNQDRAQGDVPDLEGRAADGRKHLDATDCTKKGHSVPVSGACAPRRAHRHSWRTEVAGGRLAAVLVQVELLRVDVEQMQQLRMGHRLRRPVRDVGDLAYDPRARRRWVERLWTGAGVGGAFSRA